MKSGKPTAAAWLRMLIFLLVPWIAASTVRHLDYGSFTGTRSAFTNTVTFFGIPFAQPPVGQLRFHPPMPPLNNSGRVYDATQPGTACMLEWNHKFNIGAGVTSEDCLTLNVFTPAMTTPQSNLPVFVNVYGGGFRYFSYLLTSSYHNKSILLKNLI